MAVIVAQQGFDVGELAVMIDALDDRHTDGHSHREIADFEMSGFLASVRLTIRESWRRDFGSTD